MGSKELILKTWPNLGFWASLELFEMWADHGLVLNGRLSGKMDDWTEVYFGSR